MPTSDSGPPLRPERSLRTPAHLRMVSSTGRPGRGGTTPASDSGPPLRPKRALRSPARLRTASPTGKPGQNTASDSDPRLRLGIRRTPARRSSPTGAIRADWDQSTGDTRSERTRKQTEKVRQDVQVKPQYRVKGSRCPRGGVNWANSKFSCNN